MSAESIVSAAIFTHGTICSIAPPARHGDLIALLAGGGWAMIGPEDQGFLTSTGRFVDRREALWIAQEADQLQRQPSHSYELFTEDLW